VPKSPREQLQISVDENDAPPMPKGPKRLSSSEAIQLAMMLSEQESQYGVNMYDSLQPEDEPEIQAMIAQGMSMEDAVLAIFDRKFIHPPVQYPGVPQYSQYPPHMFPHAGYPPGYPQYPHQHPPQHLQPHQTFKNDPNASRSRSVHNLNSVSQLSMGSTSNNNPLTGSPNPHVPQPGPYPPQPLIHSMRSPPPPTNSASHVLHTIPSAQSIYSTHVGSIFFSFLVYLFLFVELRKRS
jgi:hypothetical protein